MSLPHICLYDCSSVHGTAVTLDSVEEVPDTQTSQQTDINETYLEHFRMISDALAVI